MLSSVTSCCVLAYIKFNLVWSTYPQNLRLKRDSEFCKADLSQKEKTKKLYVPFSESEKYQVNYNFTKLHCETWVNVFLWGCQCSGFAIKLIGADLVNKVLGPESSLVLPNRCQTNPINYMLSGTFFWNTGWYFYESWKYLTIEPLGQIQSQIQKDK